jgi:hypothetical protein
MNTDVELWREQEGNYYSDSIHRTQSGGIGIDCGGTVFVKTLRQWHKLASDDSILDEEVAKLRREPEPAADTGQEWTELDKKFAQEDAENLAAIAHIPDNKLRENLAVAEASLRATEAVFDAIEEMPSDLTSMETLEDRAKAIQTSLASLQAENERLKEDRRRLDFLQSNPDQITWFQASGGVFEFRFNRLTERWSLNLRDAIDTALAQSEVKEK